MTTEYMLALCLSEESIAQHSEDVKDESKEIIRQRNISCSESWHWRDSQDVSIDGVSVQCDHTRTEVTFHPNWSNGTAGVRATAPLVGDVNYWEIHVGDRVFGTSLMFGVTTKKARLQSNEFNNLIGEDANGWGLSHKGFVYHNGVSTYYCKPFKEYTPVVVGILVDLKKGEITYFKDGLSLGVAFKGLNLVKDDLYPTISSTAAKTKMHLGLRLRTFTDLQDRCRQVIARSLRGTTSCHHQGTESDQKTDVVSSLPLPSQVQNFIRWGLNS